MEAGTLERRRQRDANSGIPWFDGRRQTFRSNFELNDCGGEGILAAIKGRSPMAPLDWDLVLSVPLRDDEDDETAQLYDDLYDQLIKASLKWRLPWVKVLF